MHVHSPENCNREIIREIEKTGLELNEFFEIAINSIKNKLTHTIAGGAIIIAFFSLLSRILGLLRDRLLFSTFGAGDVLDTYYAAFRLPDLIFNTLVLGALSAAFIPV